MSGAMSTIVILPIVRRIPALEAAWREQHARECNALAEIRASGRPPARTRPIAIDLSKLEGAGP